MSDISDVGMRVAVLQHVPFEGAGSILSWAKKRKALITVVRLYESVTLPMPGQFDVLIVLGGPMSANDEKDLPWLRKEKQLIANTIREGKPILGVCLGAQLMASALGARVYQEKQKEIGWFTVYSAGNIAGFRFPEKLKAFHWHGETFDLPIGAVRLASSDACVNQAFQMGNRAIGLQFHLETTPENVDSLVQNCHAELTIAPGIQTETELRTPPKEEYAHVNHWMACVLSYITRDNV